MRLAFKRSRANDSAAQQKARPRVTETTDTPIESLLRALASAPDMEALTIDQLRSATEMLAKASTMNGSTVRTDESLGGSRGAWICTPSSRVDHVILYVHGGAFVSGSIESHLPITSALAELANCRVYAVDYRLAPESLFPAALDDCKAAFKALVDDRGIKHLAVVADSAGAALALATQMSARDDGLRQADVLVLLSPWTDLGCSSSSYQARVNMDPLLSQQFLGKMAKLYLGEHDPADPSASPQFGDFTGLAPLLIQVGTREVLYGDALGLGKVAQAAGIEYDLDVWPDMIHVWHGFRDQLPEAEAALIKVSEYVQSIWSRA